MTAVFRDRDDAGQALAGQLEPWADHEDLLVLALPRGGVPVAAAVAKALGAELDVLVVRKLGTPGHEELAMGAIASGGARVLNASVIDQLDIHDDQIEAEARRQQVELERRARTYRGDRPPPRVAGRTVVVVDDGFATGATMKAAVRALRLSDPRDIVVAVPVAPAGADEEMLGLADAFVAVQLPRDFHAVGLWYRDFAQTTDAEVRSALAAHERRARAAHR